MMVTMVPSSDMYSCSDCVEFLICAITSSDTWELSCVNVRLVKLKQKVKLKVKLKVKSVIISVTNLIKMGRSDHVVHYTRSLNSVELPKYVYSFYVSRKLPRWHLRLTVMKLLVTMVTLLLVTMVTLPYMVTTPALATLSNYYIMR